MPAKVFSPLQGNHQGVLRIGQEKGSRPIHQFAALSAQLDTDNIGDVGVLQGQAVELAVVGGLTQFLEHGGAAAVEVNGAAIAGSGGGAAGGILAVAIDVDGVGRAHLAAAVVSENINVRVVINAQGQGGGVYDICTTLLGPVGGVLAMIGVIAYPITSGDTAFRSARLAIADWFKLDQANAKKRALLAVPLLAVGFVIVKLLPWTYLWRYFSWSNQSLAMIVLWTGAVFLHKYGYPPVCGWMAAAPAAFMTAVSVTYFIQAPKCLSLSTAIACPVGIVAAVGFTALYAISCRSGRRE